MSKNPITPSTLDGIKRLATRIKRENGVAHAKALDSAAVAAGFQNFTDARRQLKKSAAEGAPARRTATAPLKEFHELCRADWDAAINTISGSSDSVTAIWRGLTDIINALRPVMGLNRNHAHLPTGGGLDFLSVGLSNERGSLEFMVGDRTAYVMKPRKLTLERIDSEGNSFLLLELDEINPSGVYDTGEGESREELVEVEPGEYESREIWDRGFLDYDARGEEIPIPDEARLVVRWLHGKVLFVAKGSLWNGDPGTYDGRHNRMAASQIRSVIERSLAAQ